MNYAIAAVLWCATLVGAFFYGGSVGSDQQIAKQAKIENVIKEVREQAQLGAADAIAKNKPQNNYIKGRVETLVRAEPVYRDCVHPASGLRDINEALTGRAEPTGGVVVPGVNAVK